MVLADVEARTMTDDFTVPPAMDAAIRSYNVGKRQISTFMRSSRRCTAPFPMRGL